MQRAYLSFSDDGGRSFSPARAIDATPARGVHQWRPAIASASSRGAVVAWIDERGRSADDDLPQAQVRVAIVRGGRAEASRRLDEGAPVPLAAKLHNAWAPSVAVRGRRVLVSWIDFRTYDWRVYARSSPDGGASFGAERTLSPPSDVEVLDDSPRAAIGPRGDLVAFTDWRKRVGTAQRPHQVYDTLLSAPGGAVGRVDDHGSRQVSTFSPWPVALAGGGALVAFQDASRGVNAVRVARMTGGGRRRGTPSAVSDAGAAPWNQWRPALALVPGGSALTAWEDERDGPSQVFAARAPVGRIGGAPRPFTGARP